MTDEVFDDIEDVEPDLDDVADDDVEDEPDLAEVDDDLTLDEDITEVDAAPEEADDQVPAIDKTAKPTKRADDDEDVLELDDEHHPDDIEDPLDVLLHERTASASLEDEEEEAVEEIEVDDRAEGPTKIVPRRPGEFLCTSCFLVLPRSQLADETRMLCRDCA